MADDLGIEVVAPFEMTLPGGARLEALALVKDFGRRNGMVIASFATLRPHYDVLPELGYGFSSMAEHSPDRYRRADNDRSSRRLELVGTRGSET
ncbi:MAG TPA: hypothetical protein VJN67_04280 [Stellaceae bacterium]|nr:hypothetical protein [Stellaceae bacterium]